MLQYKILIKLSVLNFLFICCICGDTIQVEVVVLCLLVSLYSSHLYAMGTLVLGKQLLTFIEQDGHFSGSEEKLFVFTRSQTTVAW